MAVHVRPGDPPTQERYFVTPHSVERYRQRVDRRASYEQARAAIEAGIRAVAPMYPPNRPIAIGDRHKRFVAIVAPPDPEVGPWPSVMTIWGWGICPILLRKKGGPRKGWRHYRWLNGPAPAVRT